MKGKPMFMMRRGIPSTYTLDEEGDAEPISMEELAGGSIEVTAAVTIDVYASNQDGPEDKTFVLATDEDGGSLQYVFGAAGIRPFRTALYGFRYIKLVAAAGGDVYLYRKS